MVGSTATDNTKEFQYFIGQNTMNLLTAGFVVTATMVKEKIIRLQEAIKDDTE